MKLVRVKEFVLEPKVSHQHLMYFQISPPYVLLKLLLTLNQSTGIHGFLWFQQNCHAETLSRKNEQTNLFFYPEK